jgi:hypothetical protein
MGKKTLCLVFTEGGLFSVTVDGNKYNVIERAIIGHSKAGIGKQKVFSVDKVDAKKGSPMILSNAGTEAFRTTGSIREVVLLNA